MPVATERLTRLSNYFNGRWVESTASERIDVTNPATGETIAKVPMSNAAEVAAVV